MENIYTNLLEIVLDNYVNVNLHLHIVEVMTMATNTQAVRKRIYAGLYLLARRQIHALSLGLGQSKKELVRPSQAQAEPPWAGVAEWLRAAHSMLDEKAVELTHNADRPNQLRAIE